MLVLNHNILQHMFNASPRSVFVSEARNVASSSRRCGDVRSACSCDYALARGRGWRAIHSVAVEGLAAA